MKTWLAPVLCLFLVHSGLHAQRSYGGQPVSWQYPNLFSRALIPEIAPALDLQRLAGEDEADLWERRFSAPVPVDWGLENTGSWTDLPDGGRVWQLHIQSEEALGLALLYDEFYLPPGSKLFMYSPEGSQLLGQYDHRNNRSGGHFLTGFIAGKEAIIEYYEPERVQGKGQLHIFRVDQAYKASLFQEGKSRDFGDANGCHINIHCPEADAQQEVKRGVARILIVVEEGMGYCTGSLINNTSKDHTPYLLSAFHCMDGYTPLYDMWRFDFNFEALDCDDPTTAPGFQSLLGCQLRAGRQANDFLLLELFDDIPDNYNARFNGWNRQNNDPGYGALVHHPFGDLKKFSLDSAGVSVFDSPINWNNGVITPAQHHFKAELDLGTFQTGSSGGPLFDDQGLIVGQLHGGNQSCTGSIAYFGRMHLAWEGGGTPDTRLKDWLDPTGSDSTLLSGKETDSALLTISGQAVDPNGSGINNAVVSLGGDQMDEVSTTPDGAYEFSDLMPGGDYTLAITKDEMPLNGVSTFDIILIQKHILSVEPFLDPLQFLAADVNGSGTITVSDLILIRRLILGIDLEFSDRPNWQFFPADWSFGADPLDNLPPNQFPFPDLQSDQVFDLKAVKTGDVNFSADPGL